MIENLSGDFEPADYTDGYSAALQALIDAKVEGHEVVQPTTAIQDAGVEQLLAALQETAQERTDTDQATSPEVVRAKAAAEKAKESATKAKKATSKARSASKTRR
ncbi:hypothetical protein [Amycolatopsis acidicola]|uniref:hypothetical protein n=1 Tax=Amycolatopsis acidicola TaxID=2596893 RepID=UPI00312C9BED